MTMANNYPEEIPEVKKKFNQFLFSLESSLDVKSDLESQLESLNERIQKIVNSVTLNDMPILGFILQNSHDKKELKKFAKAVDRIADLIDVADNIENRISIIDTAQKDPDWFAFTFGDFSREIDEDINNIFD
jgi:hypothetical protein